MMLWTMSYFLPVHLLGVWCGSRRSAWKVLTFTVGFVAAAVGACAFSILASNISGIPLDRALGPLVAIGVAWFPFAFFMGWRR